MAGGREAGADLGPGPLRQAAVVDLPVEAAGPSRPDVETSAETRPMMSAEPASTGDVARGFAADLGAVESTSTIPATSSG